MPVPQITFSKITGFGRNSLNFGALHSADSCHAARIVLVLRHTMKRILAMSERVAVGSMYDYVDSEHSLTCSTTGYRSRQNVSAFDRLRLMSICSKKKGQPPGFRVAGSRIMSINQLLMPE